MKKRTRIEISYAFDKERQNGLGICVCEGRYGPYLPGFFPQRPAFFPGRESCLVVMCRNGLRNVADIDTDNINAGDKEPMLRLMERFQNWFQNDFSQCVSRFDSDVVRCFWQEMLEDAEVDDRPLDAAVLLIHEGHYLFLNTGEIAVYEYRHLKEKGRWWPTLHERVQLDRELGIAEAERQNSYFKYRRISKRSIFLIVPDQIQTINPEQIQKKRKREKWLQGVSQSAGAAVVIRYREG